MPLGVRPSRGDSFPPVLVMEAAENHASHNLAVLGKGMFVVILQRWENSWPTDL